MSDPLRHLPEGAKYAIDGLSVASLLGSFAQVLPHVATLLTIVWMSLRIWESRTVQGWFGRAVPEAKGGEDA